MTSTHDFANFASGIDAQQSDVIDDWEDGDKAEYSGDTGSVTVQQTTVFEGSDAAEIAEGQNFVYSTEGSGLPVYPDAGDDFVYQQYYQSGSIGQFAYGLQDASNYYLIEVDQSAGAIALYVVSGGSRTELNSASLTVPTGEWDTILVSWGADGLHKVAFDDATGTRLAKFEAQDSTYTGGGVGWGENSTAPSVTTIDDFEDNNLSEYSADTADFTTTTTNAFVNSYALHSDASLSDEKFPVIISQPGDGLNYYPDAGDRILYWARAGGNSTAKFFFGVQDLNEPNPTGYSVVINPGGNEILIRKEDGTGLIASGSVTLSADTYYDCRVEWGSSGTLTFAVYDQSGTKLKEISATDSSYTDGGVAFLNNTGGSSSDADVYFDNVRAEQGVV